MKCKPFYQIHPRDWLLASNQDVSFAQTRAIAEPDKDESQIEEYVRQWVIRELIVSYKYPKEWLGERMTVEETVQVATAEKEADIAIKNDRGRPYIFIETKATSVTSAELEKAERQLETYLSATHTATVGMITNGYITKVIRKKVNPNDFEYIADIPEYGDPDKWRAKLVRDLDIIKTKRGKVGLEPLPKRSQVILFEAHSAIRDIDGLHDDNALGNL